MILVRETMASVRQVDRSTQNHALSRETDGDDGDDHGDDHGDDGDDDDDGNCKAGGLEYPESRCESWDQPRVRREGGNEKVEGRKVGMGI